MDIVTIIKQLAADQNMSINQLCDNVGLSPQNMVQKFKRDSLYYTDVIKLLDGLGYQFQIIQKNNLEIL